MAEFWFIHVLEVWEACHTCWPHGAARKTTDIKHINIEIASFWSVIFDQELFMLLKFSVCHFFAKGGPLLLTVCRRSYILRNYCIQIYKRKFIYIYYKK